MPDMTVQKSVFTKGPQVVPNKAVVKITFKWFKYEYFQLLIYSLTLLYCRFKISIADEYMEEMHYCMRM